MFNYIFFYISYLKAIEISPQNDFYYNLGEILVELKEWDSAIEAFKTVLKNDSKDANCYFNLGLCYYNKDEINLASDNFQEAVRLNPNDLFAHFYLGCIYQNNGLTNFAIESYKKVLAISPDYSWAYYNLASISYKNENLEEAKEDAKDIVMASKNLLEIVNGILDISKIEADKMEIIESNYNPVEVFGEITSLIESKLLDTKFKNISFSLSESSSNLPKTFVLRTFILKM